MALYNNGFENIIDQFENTNSFAEIKDLSTWPLCGFESLSNMQRSLKSFKHRITVGISKHYRSDIIAHYTSICTCFIKSLVHSITETDHSFIWMDLIAYKMIIKAKENVGLIFAFGVGATYGENLTINEYIDIAKNFALMAEHLDTALDYSSYVYELFQLHKMETTESVTNFSAYIEVLSEAILQESVNNSALTNYFETNAIEYFRILRDVKRQLVVYITSRIDSEQLNLKLIESLYICAFLISVIIAPVLILMMKRLTNKLQTVARNLLDKSKELHEEKYRADALLYQMLPRQVVKQLKLNNKVDAEFYEHATVFFSDIVGFTIMSAKASPIDIVDFLNKLYQFFDDCLDVYDVYKVETIGDAYMVVSGVPQRNGTLHCSEIALMALDILEGTKEFQIPHLPNETLMLRIGIHTGPCCSGVVGNKMPRFCLFGDTVNTASRMESCGSRK
ncbi:hypothetical protein ScPMuIL_008126 [Solemya velum]